MTKKIWLAGVFLGLSALAADSPGFTKAIHAFQNLDYGKKADRQKGQSLVPGVLVNLKRFSTIPAGDPSRADQFHALLELVQEAAPYDEKGELVGHIAKITLSDDGLRSDTEFFLDSQKPASLREQCKAKYFHNVYAEKLCAKGASLRSSAPVDPRIAANGNCGQTKFSFAGCWAGK